MARGKQDKLYRSFVKGLITEAGFLTYPEDASTDELNTVIFSKGNRTRRPGINYEELSVPTDILAERYNSWIEDYLTPASIDENTVTTEYFWRFPGNNNDRNFLVVQIGDFLYFWTTAIEPLTNGIEPFVVDLKDFMSPSGTDELVRNNRVHMTSGKGYLFVAHPYCDPFVLSYDYNNNIVTATPLILQIRDLDGVDDDLPNDAEPVNLTIPHKYNLYNQGWVTPGTPETPTTGGSAPGTTRTYYNPWKGKYYDPDDISDL